MFSEASPHLQSPFKDTDGKEGPEVASSRVQTCYLRTLLSPVIFEEIVGAMDTKNEKEARNRDEEKIKKETIVHKNLLLIRFLEMASLSFCVHGWREEQYLSYNPPHD